MSRFTEHLQLYQAHMRMIADHLGTGRETEAQRIARREATIIYRGPKQTALAERITKPHASAVPQHNAIGGNAP
jgi:hypothetical protein